MPKRKQNTESEGISKRRRSDRIKKIQEAQDATSSTAPISPENAKVARGSKTEASSQPSSSVPVTRKIKATRVSKAEAPSQPGPSVPVTRKTKATRGSKAEASSQLIPSVPVTKFSQRRNFFKVDTNYYRTYCDDSLTKDFWSPVEPGGLNYKLEAITIDAKMMAQYYCINMDTLEKMPSTSREKIFDALEGWCNKEYCNNFEFLKRSLHPWVYEDFVQLILTSFVVKKAFEYFVKRPFLSYDSMDNKTGETDTFPTLFGTELQNLWETLLTVNHDRADAHRWRQLTARLLNSQNKHTRDDTVAMRNRQLRQCAAENLTVQTIRELKSLQLLVDEDQYRLDRTAVTLFDDIFLVYEEAADLAFWISTDPDAWGFSDLKDLHHSFDHETMEVRIARDMGSEMIASRRVMLLMRPLIRRKGYRGDAFALPIGVTKIYRFADVVLAETQGQINKRNKAAQKED